MRILAAFGLMLFFALGCAYNKSDDPELDQELEATCANVTDTNWRASTMRSRSSHQVCVEAVYYQQGNGVTARPCVFGGYPMLCAESERGIAIFKTGMTPIEVIFIDATDVPLVRPNIVNL